MTGDRNAPDQDELSLILDKQQLNRLLIEQFYEDSVGRYGTGSEQARTFSRSLSPLDSDGPNKSD